MSFLRGKVLLVTGGTGSFGQALVRRVLQEDEPEKVIVFSRDEWKQWEMQRSDPLFRDERLRYFLGDVRDKERLMRAFHGVHYIVHAAALKQVPAAEYNPSEFIKTNVLGAMNLIDAAIDCNVEKVISLSTDKAVNPANLYGATKLCSDKLFVTGNVYVGDRSAPLFSVVRYGNVLGSRGSVIQVYRELLEQGSLSLPVTDTRMTRFWISLEEAVDVVLQTFQRMQGGEIFVPKIPSMKIIDLVRAMSPEAKIEICGLRPGEKIHELMIGAEDAPRTLELDNAYVIVSEQGARKSYGLRHPLWKEEAKLVADDFTYASHTNERWLDVEQLRKYLTRFEKAR